MRVATLSALVVAALLSGCGGGGTTAASTKTPPIKLAVIGDFGVGRAAERALGAAVRATHPDVLVTVGDNNYARPHSFRPNWDASFGWAKNVVAALGNHDIEYGNGDYQLPILGMPAHYYFKRFGAVELIVLDSNKVDEAQTEFLRERLTSSDATWKIPVFHHPPYLCGSERPSKDVRRLWVPLFRTYGVRLVLTGHDHDYERFDTPGTVYVVDGGGAADLYPLRPCKPGTPVMQASNDTENTFLVLSVTSALIRGEARTVAGGRVIDRFKLFP